MNNIEILIYGDYGISGSVLLHVNLQLGGRLAEKVTFLTSKRFLASVRKHVVLQTT